MSPAADRLIEWLLNRARPYVFSTAAPAATAAAALAALDIVRQEPERRAETVARSQALREELVRRGWNTGARPVRSFPWLSAMRSTPCELSAQLRECGLFVPAIRPPTVPEGEACLRISLTAGHTEEMIAALLAAFGTCRAY